MRGYKAGEGQNGDEQQMLETLLNRPGVEPVVIRAQPDRYQAAQAVLKDRPDVSVFVMDDGFQHRRLARDFDLVLIDATEPFGYDRVLPRGLLREPIGGIARADAVLITRASSRDVGETNARIRMKNDRAPIHRCDHVQIGFIAGDGTAYGGSDLLGRRYFAFAGIGNPEGFAEQLRQSGGAEVGRRWFADHWAYTRADVEQVQAKAQSLGAEVILTTEKDWVKAEPLVRQSDHLPIWRVQVAIRFEDPDQDKLLEQIRAAIDNARRRT
jgi:tetraacyldisaccharide 4'-kinase